MDAIVRSRAMSKLAEKWAAGGCIGTYITEQTENTLGAYRRQPNLVAEHANTEEDTARGGYARRQLFELVQNGADALSLSDGGQIWIRLTPTHLYCADNGRAIDEDGVRALMFSHLSPKRGTKEIGRFGLGFKSVLGVTDTPEFFSRSGSFRFDRASAEALIRDIAPDTGRFPALRLPENVHPIRQAAADPVLREMMGWATNIVRLPLNPGAHQSLGGQIEEFRAEFLLFVKHVGRLVLQTGEQEVARTVSLTHSDGKWLLDDGVSKARWMIANVIHKLSDDAKSDSRSLDDADEVPLWWAVPVDRLNDPGKFWAFFPTLTTSLLAGILNAPWKTNEDRQNLLPGVYNDELIDAAARMVADALSTLSTPEEPARHLDALPRRQEAVDNEHSVRLRDQLTELLRGRALVPDQNGELRKLSEVSYPPQDLRESALQRWAAYDKRPADWLHHRAMTRNRLAVINRIFPSRVYRHWDGSVGGASGLQHASIEQWLEALVGDAKSKQSELADRLEALKRRASPLPIEEIQRLKAQWEQPIVEASKAAIQTASLIPGSIRANKRLGNIVLRSDGGWVQPDPDSVFLGGGDISNANNPNLVHPQLETDPEALSALEKLGLKLASAETEFRSWASNLLSPPHHIPVNWREYLSDETNLDLSWRKFWQLARDIDQSRAVEIIRESNSYWNWRDSLFVRTVDEEWRSLFKVLLPGHVVPEDGSRDTSVTLDVQFHRKELSLLKQLGATDTPRNGHELSHDETRQFAASKRIEFTARDLPREPHRDKLNFDQSTTSGPLDVLESLSDEGKALYTWKLLDLSDTYEQWTMRHDTQDIYPPMEFEPPAIEVLRQHGRIQTDDGIHKLSDGLGDPPQNQAVLHKLLSHPQASLIRRAFEIRADIDVPVEPIGEDDSIPMVDVWRGLGPHLSMQQLNLELVRCDGFHQLGGVQSESEQEYVIKNNLLYIVRKDDEQQELRSVLNALGLRLGYKQTQRILRGLTDEDVKAARDEVRRCSTDEERLLKSVGESNLRRHLPQGLLEILENTQGPLSGITVAQAAIATYHTGALHEYRHSLGHLDPPRQWAGRAKAVEFVRSLGFSEEWAGEPNTRRDPYIEVEGPYSLPELHGYQRTVVDNVRKLIRPSGALGERRGMISMPTGSGKTRVAVQAIVEAIRDDAFEGGILWVADRDELCEQAVVAWRQVWSSEGAQETRLRISRMWAGQPRPLPTGDMHVIIATMQTLWARIERQPEFYEFLADFKLLVFDEAHRSVAPTFTSVMQELGLTRWRRPQEPFLIGLTATPYRGRDERGTERLVNRYGSNRLHVGAFASDHPEDVIRELQDMRILARADHAAIDGGRFHLSADELRQSQNTPWLPRSVEDRIARSTDRTKRIIEAYQKLVDPAWPTLFFATSVEHAQTVAALLTSMGVKSRAVSATTDASSRRSIVEQFRSGEIKALVNYGIFREGFDAPKTRAIIVARPVYSPNLYFQMVGRGLRGVKNGGNDRCLILNVRDNIENFKRKLAFSELDWLWD